MAETVVDIDLTAPLNLSFVNKKDKQGKFIRNSGVLSEAGLHNAFIESGEGQWLGDFDEQEIRNLVPVTRVLEFNDRFNIGSGRLVWLTPAIYAIFPNFNDNFIRLSDGRSVEIPSTLRNLNWKASSGIGNQYLIAVSWGGVHFHTHIFHINTDGNPTFSQINISTSTTTNITTAPVNAFRMATGELGEQTLHEYLNAVNKIDCYPVIFGHLPPDVNREQITISFYGATDDDFPGLPNVGAIVGQAISGRPGQWLVIFIDSPTLREDPPMYIPDPNDPEEFIPNPDFDPNKKYERIVFLERVEILSENADILLHVGIDIGSFSLNSCAVIRVNPNDTFTLIRVVKGFYMPDLSGNVWGYPFPDDHVTIERGYSPRLRFEERRIISIVERDIPLNPETISAINHRGVVYHNNMLHHLSDTPKSSSNLNDTQTRTWLVAAWNADRLTRLPFRTSQNLNGRYSVPPNPDLGNLQGITAFFHGFAGIRQQLRVTSNGQAFDIPHFGGFYCVPTRTHSTMQTASYGIAQYSMAGALEIRHRSFSSRRIVEHHYFREIWPAGLNMRQGDTLALRHYISRGHFAQERNIRNRSWRIEQAQNIINRTGSLNNNDRTAYFIGVNPGRTTIIHTSEQQHGAVWRWHTQRIEITVIEEHIETSNTGEMSLQLDCGRVILNYPAKEGVNISHSSYGVLSINPANKDFNLLRMPDSFTAFANIFYSGDTNIPAQVNENISPQLLHSPQALGIFDAWVFGVEGIDVFITMAAGEALWTSINDTKVSTGAPEQILCYENAVLLVFDKYTVYAHSTNNNGQMVPDIRLITFRIALISQTGTNIVAKELERIIPQHAFSGLGYRTNIIGRSHTSGADEVQSNFQDILQNNRQGNVLPPNAFSLPQGFSALIPPYEQPVQHININTPPSQIRENINAFRYALPISVRRGTNLDEWVIVRGNNIQLLIIDGFLTLTSNIIAASTRLQQIIVLGQRFVFDEMFITPVNFEMGQRIYGESINKFNKIYAGSSTQRAYFFDRVSKSIDAFTLDSGFSPSRPLDLIDAVLQAVPIGEFSYTNVRRLCEKKGVEEVLLHMAPDGVFFRDFGSFKVENGIMQMGDSGLLIQRENNWELLRNTVLFEHLEAMVSNNTTRFGFSPFGFQTAFYGESGLFIVPRFWEVDFYLSNAVRVLHKGQEDKLIKVKMGSESIADSRKWKQPIREYSMRIKDFRDGYYTLRMDCLAEECSSQSLIFETNDYVHISGIAFKYVTRSGGTDR